LDPTGCHGLISAPIDQAAGPLAWHNTFTTTGAYSSCDGCGFGNTTQIIRTLGAGSYPAQICYDLVLNGYSDWYMPSVHELKLMHSNIGQGNKLGLGNIGGFVNNGYWSSTEDNPAEAWYHNFTGLLGGTSYTSKFSNAYIRAVRQF
jgi:hypothetical protein